MQARERKIWRDVTTQQRTMRKSSNANRPHRSAEAVTAPALGAMANREPFPLGAKAGTAHQYVPLERAILPVTVDAAWLTTYGSTDQRSFNGVWLE
jgi:hypothetical protein